MLCLGTAEHKDVRWARDVALTPLLVRVDIVYMWVRALMFPLVGRGGSMDRMWDIIRGVDDSWWRSDDDVNYIQSNPS